MKIAFSGLGDIPPEDANLSQRAKFARVSGSLSPSSGTGNRARSPSNRFLRDIPSVLRAAIQLSPVMGGL